MPLCKFHFILESRWIHRYFTDGITDGLWLKVTYFKISSEGYNDYLGGTHCEYLPDIQPFNNYHQQRDTPLSCLSTMRAQHNVYSLLQSFVSWSPMSFRRSLQSEFITKMVGYASLETAYCFILTSYSSVDFGLTWPLCCLSYQLLEVWCEVPAIRGKITKTIKILPMGTFTKHALYSCNSFIWVIDCLLQLNT